MGPETLESLQKEAIAEVLEAVPSESKKIKSKTLRSW